MVVLLESGKRDLNSRPQPWQGCALPTELFPHCPYCHSGLQSYANIPTFQIFLEKFSSSMQHSVLFTLNLAHHSIYETQDQNKEDIENPVPVRAGGTRAAVIAVGGTIQVRAGKMDPADA